MLHTKCNKNILKTNKKSVNYIMFGFGVYILKQNTQNSIP